MVGVRVLAALGFGLAAQATGAGLLSPIARGLWRMEVSLSGAPATLPGLLGVSPWWLVAPLAAENIPRWAQGAGHAVTVAQTGGTTWEVLIRKA